tara:strand:- start:2199 stop:2678 length:480 start_codon:yes stop_codon:yes gene_type:complete
MEKYMFSNEWNLWFHSINNNNWENSSYRKLITIRNLLDYKMIIDIFKQKHYQDGMFFLMKGNIFPTWEDPKNRLGGCLSFKIPSTEIINDWNNLLLKTFIECLLKNKNNDVNGISISPKKEFNIIKIWFINDKEEYKTLFNEILPNLTLKNSIYKKHGK